MSIKFISNNNNNNNGNAKHLVVFLDTMKQDYWWSRWQVYARRNKKHSYITRPTPKDTHQRCERHVEAIGDPQ